MLIILDSYELNALSRRADDEDHSDLTRSTVISNSLRFSEDKIDSALETVLGSDKLLFLDLRPRLNKGVQVALGGGAARPHPADDLPALALPDPESFRYIEAPTLKTSKTYRLDYLVTRLGRERQQLIEEEFRGEMQTLNPAPAIETMRSSLECELSDLREAVELVSSSANGSLIWLQITLHDDGFYSGLRSRTSTGFAEPSAQPSAIRS